MCGRLGRNEGGAALLPLAFGPFAPWKRGFTVVDVEVAQWAGPREIRHVMPDVDWLRKR